MPRASGEQRPRSKWDYGTAKKGWQGAHGPVQKPGQEVVAFRDSRLRGICVTLTPSKAGYRCDPSWGDVYTAPDRLSAVFSACARLFRWEAACPVDAPDTLVPCRKVVSSGGF